MSTLKAILLAFILPPVNLALLAMIGLVLARYRPRLGWTVATISMAGLLLLSLPVVSGRLLLSLEEGSTSSPPSEDPPRAIVILGAEVTRVRNDPTRSAIAGQMTLDRLRTGAAVARRTDLPILVTGGSAQTDVPPVGALMASSLTEDFRVPVRWAETVSRDTWQNATLSARILQQEGIRSVYLVTSSWHMRRSLLAFRRAGLVATPVPASPPPPMTLAPADFIPRAGAWEVAYFAFHEWIGIVWYSLP
ncbi:MAG: hypothetical protein QG637_407 [Chloroflexota bacterium]|nr:hypothetical protein [Chloroflexota bacterium]